MKTLIGTITVLKDKEGNVKIPRTTATAVQLNSGEDVEAYLSRVYNTEQIDQMFANLSLNGEVTLASYASKEYVDDAIGNHSHSYNNLTDLPEILTIEEAVSKDFLQEELNKLPVLDNVEIISLLNDKVDVIEGKGLSENDFSNEYKAIIDRYEEDLKPVAFSGSYEDLIDKPNIDVSKAYVDGMFSLCARVNHKHEEYLSYLPSHAHSDLYYDKTEIDKKLMKVQFDIAAPYSTLKTNDKTIIGAINEIYDNRLTTASVNSNEVQLTSLTTSDTDVLTGINEKFDMMEKEIESLKARVKELESLLK